MSPLVNSTLMDTTWRSVGAASAADMRQMQKLAGKEQAELTAFVAGITADLGVDAVGLALYMHIVLSQAFRQTKAKFRKVKVGKIDRAWRDNSAIIAELKSAGHTRAPFVFPPEKTPEPAALQYIVDALTEQDGADPIPMTEHEFWHVLQVLKTYCDCMHDAAAN